MVYEAWSRGHAAVGVEVQELWAGRAAENLAAMRDAAATSRSLRRGGGGRYVGEGGSGGGGSQIFDDDDDDVEKSRSINEPPVVHHADARNWVRDGRFAIADATSVASTAAAADVTAAAAANDYPFDCLVSNLPYGHAISLGGVFDGYAATEDQQAVMAAALEDLRPLLSALAPLAPVGTSIHTTRFSLNLRLDRGKYVIFIGCERVENRREFRRHFDRGGVNRRPWVAREDFLPFFPKP